MKNLLTLFLIITFFHCNGQEIDTKNVECRDGIFYEIGKEKPFTGKGITYFENGNLIKVKDLKTTVSEILLLASEKNIKKLNEKYINKDFGVYDIYRIGVPDRFKKLTTIPEKTKGWSIYYTLTFTKNKKQELQEATVQFDCENSVWNKKGLFYSRTITNPLLSEIVKYETENEGKKFSKERIEKIKFIENNSIRIVETVSNLIFYLTKINEAWYITLIDRVTTDCSV